MLGLPSFFLSFFLSSNFKVLFLTRLLSDELLFQVTPARLIVDTTTVSIGNHLVLQRLFSVFCVAPNCTQVAGIEWRMRTKRSAGKLRQSFVAQSRPSGACAPRKT